VIGCGHRLTALIIRGRATPVLNHWPVGPLLPMTRRPVFPESLVDLAHRLLGKLLPRHRDPDRRLLGVASERLRRPAAATIEQRICCSNSSVRSVALSHFLEEALDSLSRMVSGEFPDRCNAAWTAAGVTRLARCPSSVRVTHRLISACSEVTSKS
jgi:hypothetical protein